MVRCGSGSARVGIGSVGKATGAFEATRGFDELATANTAKLDPSTIANTTVIRIRHSSAQQLNEVQQAGVLHRMRPTLCVFIRGSMRQAYSDEVPRSIKSLTTTNSRAGNHERSARADARTSLPCATRVPPGT